MARFIVLGVLALPLFEIAGFILVGKAIGVLATLGLVLLSALVGVAILRIRGVAMPQRLRAALSSGTLPAEAFADGALVAVAAMLLIVPGFATDLLGLLLLVPPVRGLLLRLAGRHMRVASFTVGPAPGDTRRGPDTIELESDAWRDR